MSKEILKIVQVREKVGRDAVNRGIPVVKPEIGQFLSVLTRGAKVRRILEVGTAVGYSTLWLAEAIWDNDGEIVTIEKDEERAKEAETNFDSAGVTGMIKLYNCDAGQLLPSLQGNFDCIFLDAAKGQYLDYLPRCLQLLTSGGLLIADNVLFRGMIDTEEEPPKRYRSLVRKLRLFIEEIKSNDQLVSSILDIGDGMAVCVRR